MSTAVAATLGLIAAALLLRLPSFGDPAFHVDEEFYLLVGDRMLHGAIPYVDIWDRKPIGLFLVYAAIRLLGGDGILQYQIVAALFAGGTAACIFLLSRRTAGTFGGVAAGLVYLVWIETVEGGGGQSPVFYNLFMAMAACCIFAAGETRDLRRFGTLGFAAMALTGVAIQVKYTALFEGLYFGLLLAWWSIRRCGGLLTAIPLTAAFALTALVPTIAAIAVYAALGHLDIFWYSNFVSIFHRGPASSAELHHRIVQMLLHVVPLLVCFLASLCYVWRTGSRDARSRLLLVGGWMVAALCGFFSVGALFFHYMLPLFVPFAVGASPIFRQRPVGPFFAFTAIFLPLSHLSYPDFATTRHSRDQIAELVALIPPQVDTGCMELLAGPPILYKLTNACFVTPYIFPDHLLGAKEAGATGTDAVAELGRVMKARPLALVTDDTPRDMNMAVYRLLRATRDAAYRRAGRVVMDGMTLDVWIRRS
ncbi:ArnT family glycosyltransferase [Sphingomonas nostoxanthinifaciens]|uniref:ArnT family glycosyltransferase n=1 Tax=Sphingomonas nostoxanthinifaciens TaxID=2872652 RepID=UPI001CC1D08E|nr:hypothetical protein [Sphingomonas nostoxanthinifaciens]UAK23422.1 hypothetical protein K8P63_13585 [Sphingomonas nostoxanthinifaciens]